ncbi:MAG: 23S rRNA (pseudouridine(1915)-N(3))-methyltransferase RlmH [Bacilli bacterium]|nr:23S rRNA (pseudouridine(1915)-N(3))-methyltransferase RlmH [Bacilli bacterium]
MCWKIKEKYLVDAIEEYKKRISRYTKLEIIELKDHSIDDINKVLELEKEQIERYIDSKDYVITMEIEGEQVSSEKFAEKIDNVLSINSNITFIIGGSYGLDNSIKNRANYHLSFSKMTFPHQLFRVLLLEQIYRAYKINNNESYHK